MDRNSKKEFVTSFGALVTGVVIGILALFFSNEKNRKKVNTIITDWHKKIENQTEDLKQKGLDTVSKELSKAQTEVKKYKK